MAKKTETETRTAIDDVNESLTNLEQKVQNNQKMIMWVCLAVVAVICAILIYIYAIRRPGIEAADNAIGQADTSLAMGNDSIALAQYQQVADEYGYEAGNRASLNAAILLFRKGDYESAISYLENYSPKENIIGASAKALQGDCYVNLKQYDNAIECFRKAAEISDNNPRYTPLFLMKQATVQRELKNYRAEADLYREIIDNYPDYGGAMNIDFQKYLKRAELQSEESK